MALGFGAALAIYAFADAALVEPLPYRDPARLVEVTERSRQVPHANMSHPDFVDWKRQQTVFSGFDVHNARRFSLSTPAGLVPVRGGRVSPGLLPDAGRHACRRPRLPRRRRRAEWTGSGDHQRRRLAHLLRRAP